MPFFRVGGLVTSEIDSQCETPRADAKVNLSDGDALHGDDIRAWLAAVRNTVRCFLGSNRLLVHCS